MPSTPYYLTRASRNWLSSKELTFNYALVSFGLPDSTIHVAISVSVLLRRNTVSTAHHCAVTRSGVISMIMAGAFSPIEVNRCII
jgi:hypothetical protein